MTKPVDPCKREYNLKAQLKFVKGSTTVLGKQVERTMAILIPEDNDQRTYFLSAWLPDVREQHYELVGYMPLPVDSNVRFSIHRAPDKYSERHYLFVMTKGVEEILVEHVKEGTSLLVRILSEDEEIEADSVRDSHGNYDVLEHGDESQV